MTLSDVIQISSFVAEAVGLTLTMIGVLNKTRFAKIENTIIKGLEKRDYYWRKYNRTIFWFFGIYMVVSWTILTFSNYFDPNSTFISIAIVLFAVVLFLGMVYGLLRRAFPNHQVLTLGLCISFLSLLGELYQVCQIF